MADPVISWDENLEPDIAFYKAYWGFAPGVYTAPGSPKIMGNTTSGTIPVNVDGDVYVAITAVNTAGLESAFSTPETAGKILTAKGAVRAR
jgi:hypothetical protein